MFRNLTGRGEFVSALLRLALLRHHKAGLVALVPDSEGVPVKRESVRYKAIREIVKAVEAG